MIHVFFDPGEHAGYAVFVDKVLQEYGEVNGSKPQAIHKCIKSLTEKYKTDEQSLNAVIEAGFIGINKHTSLRLAERRGMAHAVFEIAGYAVEYLFVSEWQVILGKKEKGESKKLSLEIANKHLPSPIKNHNVSDAICQGLYYLQLHTK